MTATPALRTPLRSNFSRLRARLALASILLVAVVAWFPRVALAEGQEPKPPSVGGILKKVALDPTTYAPALLSYDATLRDWKTSQVFFANGFHEWNERFTVSGLPNDSPVSYSVGRQRILKDTLITLQISALNNFATHTVEGLLVQRFPKHRRLIKTLAVIDRVVSASYMSYRLSAKHYQQASYNTALARSLGYR